MTNATLPTEAAARKGIPLFSGLIKYFPKALAAVAEVSKIGNEQHHPGTPLHWDRSKSSDELEAAARHLWEAGTRDALDGCRHSAKLAWRALANLEKEIEREEAGASLAAAGLNDEAVALTFGEQTSDIDGCRHDWAINEHNQITYCANCGATK